MNMTYFEDYLYLMANKICHRRIRSHCENLLMWEWKANPQNYTEYRWRISFDEMFCSCQLRWSSSEGFFCITDICPVIWFSALSETLCFPSLAKKNKSSHEAPPELEKKIQSLVINAQNSFTNDLFLPLKTRNFYMATAVMQWQSLRQIGLLQIPLEVA